MCFHLFPHPFGERHRRVEHRARKQQHELLAAVATDSIDLADFGAQDARELFEDRVAGLVAVLVVHALEPVQVAHDAGERFGQAARVLEHLVEPLLQMAAVVDRRQRIGLRHVPQPLVRLEQLPLALLERVLQSFDAQHRLHARLELGEIDRLGDVVVGAGLEPFDLALGRVERRLHDDRDEGQGIASFHPPRDLDPVDLGHHDVEQDEIGWRLLDLVQRLRAVGRTL